MASETIEAGEHTLVRMPNPLFPDKDILVVQKLLEQGKIVGMDAEAWKFLAERAKDWNFWDDWRIKLVKLPALISAKPTVPQEDQDSESEDAVASS